MHFYRILPSPVNEANPGSTSTEHVDKNTNLVINVLSREQLDKVNFGEHENELFMFPEVGEPMCVVSTMPSPSYLLSNRYVLYIGNTTSEYEKYSVYKCILSPDSEVQYIWEPVQISSVNLSKIFLTGTEPPYSHTVGVIGQHYLNTMTKESYICTGIEYNDGYWHYVWEKTASEIAHGICTTSKGVVEKHVNIENFVLVEGVIVMVTFVNGNSAHNPTLNILNTGTIPIKCDGAAIIPNMISDNMTAILRYDGSAYILLNPAFRTHNHDTLYAPLSHMHSGNEITGLGDAAFKNIGTGSDNVAAGDHNHTGVYAPIQHTHNNYMPVAGGVFTGMVTAQNNASYTTKQIRNITLSTGNPTGGGNGDIWFKYSS